MSRRKRLTFWGVDENDDSLPRSVMDGRKTVTKVDGDAKFHRQCVNPVAGYEDVVGQVGGRLERPAVDAAHDALIVARLCVSCRDP